MTTSATTMEKQSFASWGGKEIGASDGFTGVITYRRANGSRLCEREVHKDATWGCSRYYNEQNQYVGQEWYGRPGYNEKSLAYVSKSIVVHESWVDHAEYQRIYNATTANYEDKKRQVTKYEFKSNGGDWAGVEVSFGPHGKPLVEQEMKGGSSFGCRRYYNEQGQLVGQELYGGVDWAAKNDGRPIAPVDTSAKTMRSPPPAHPFLTRFVTKSDFEAVKKEFQQAMSTAVEATSDKAQLQAAKPAASVEVASTTKFQKDKDSSFDEAPADDSLSTLDSTRSDHSTTAETNKPDMTLLSSQIAELMQRQSAQEKVLWQEQEKRQAVEEQFQKERLERAQLARKLEEMDACVVTLKQELDEAEHKHENSAKDDCDQLKYQRELIQEQQDLLRAERKQQEEQQTAIVKLREEFEWERKQRQLQQTEIANLRKELERMRVSTEQPQAPLVDSEQLPAEVVAWSSGEINNKAEESKVEGDASARCETHATDDGCEVAEGCESASSSQLEEPDTNNTSDNSSEENNEEVEMDKEVAEVVAEVQSESEPAPTEPNAGAENSTVCRQTQTEEVASEPVHRCTHQCSSRCHHSKNDGPIVEDPKPRYRRQNSKHKMKFLGRVGSSFKLPGKSKSKESMSKPGPAAVSAAASNQDNSNTADDVGSFTSSEALTLPSKHTTSDEQEVQAKNDAAPKAPSERTLSLEQSLDSGDGNGEQEEASVSSIQMGNLENEEAPQEDEVTLEQAVQDPVPRRTTKERKGAFSWNPHASLKAIAGVH